MQTNILGQEVILRIVYYGLPGAGKKKALEEILQEIPELCSPEIKKEHGKASIYTMEYFPPTRIFEISKMKTRCLLHGFCASIDEEKLIQDYFSNVDGVVFVINAQKQDASQILENLQKLQEILHANNHSLDEFPIYFQFYGVETQALDETWDEVLPDGKPFAICQRSGDSVSALNSLLQEISSKVKIPSLKLPKKKLSLGIPKKGEESDSPKSDAPKKLKTMPLPAKWRSERKAAVEESTAAKASARDMEDEEEILTSSSLDKIFPQETEILPIAKPKPLSKSVPEEKAEEAEAETPLDIPAPAHPLLPKKDGLPFQIAEPVEKAADIPQEKPHESSMREEAKPLLPPIEKFSLDEEAGNAQEKNTIATSEKEEIVPPKQEPEDGLLDEILRLNPPAKPDAASDQKGKITLRRLIPPKVELPPTLPPKKDFSETAPYEEEDFAADPGSLTQRGQQNAVEFLRAGKQLDGWKIDVLDISGIAFDVPVCIIHCEIRQLIAEGAEFKKPVTIEGTVIHESMVWGSEDGCIARETVQFKNLKVKEIDAEKCIFLKDFVLTECQVEDFFKMPNTACEQALTLLNCKIGGITCQESLLKGPVLVSGCEVTNIANFQNSTVLGTFLASGSTFHRAHFIEAEFHNKTEFVRCIFQKSANWGKALCEKGIHFQACVFNGHFNMGEAYLKSESYFTRTEFCGDASFSKLESSDLVCFEKASFVAQADLSCAYLRDVDFLETTFYGGASFQEAIFFGKVRFLKCQMEHNILFRRAVVTEKIDFRETQWKGKVSFANMLCEFFEITREQVEGHLLADAQKDHALAEQEYLTLRQIFEKHKRHEDKEWAHYRARQAARKKTKFSLLHPWKSAGRMWNWFFLDLGCGYGTKPANVLLMSFFFIALFAAIYGFFFPAQFEMAGATEVQKWAAASWHSLVTFLPAGVEHWKGIAVFSATPEFGFKVLMVLENILGFFFLFLFLITFVRKLLQE